MQFHDYRSIFVSSILWKARKKTIRLRTTHALLGETSSDQWNLHTKGQQCEKHSSCNSSISGLHILKRPITHNSENIWASSDYVSLATILFVQQRIQEKCKNASKFPPHCSLMRRIHRWPPESPQKGPAMRKALIMQFQNNRSIIDSSLSWTKTVTSHEHQGISHPWQLYCFFNSPYTKTLESRNNNKAPLYWSPVGRVHRRKKETQSRGPAKQKLVHHTFSGLHLFHQYYVKLNKFSTTYHVHYWSYMRRIHWWPMDSPHQGPTKRNT